MKPTFNLLLALCGFAAAASYGELTVLLRAEVQALDNPTDTELVTKYKSMGDQISTSILQKYNTKLHSLFRDAPGFDGPSHARFFTVADSPENVADAVSLIKELRAHKNVESAYATPETTLPRVIRARDIDSSHSTGRTDSLGKTDSLGNIDALGTTPDFVPLQGYRRPAAQGGLDVDFANRQPGGLGDGVQVFDVEYAWLPGHEDLMAHFDRVLGQSSSSPGLINHGTAVAGVIEGNVNGFGINGIAPNASFSGSGVRLLDEVSVSPAQAIVAATRFARAGDVILLEQQRNWVSVLGTPGKFIAIEWWPQDFLAIRTATDLGFVVVEAAGNGERNGGPGQNFDDPIFEASRLLLPNESNNFDPDTLPVFGDALTIGSPFNLANPQSGAILVGAGAGGLPVTAPARSRLNFSGYGSRVDVQAWGENVVSTSFFDSLDARSCDLFRTVDLPGSPQCYTKSFGGTSSASAIIAGVVASVQGTRKAQGKTPLSAAQFQALFRDPANGQAQTDAPGRPARTQRIGNLPDLARLIPKALAL